MTGLPEGLRELLPGGVESLRTYYGPLGEPDARLGNPDRRPDDWLLKISNAARGSSFGHDEPWVTLVCLYALFGDQDGLVTDRERCAAFNELLGMVCRQRTGGAISPEFAALTGVRVEVQLPENRRFRQYLRDSILAEGPQHLYADRREVLARKLQQAEASLEGNTNLDALVSGRGCDGRQKHVFIEAKFGSDISKDITYLPVRNQLARNIDCAIDLMTQGGEDPGGLGDLWFVLLTPGVFRVLEYGGPATSPYANLHPERSRLYCYKMADYLDPARLREDLPHWAGVLSEEQWRMVVRRLGWVTYEELAGLALTRGTIRDGQAAALQAFMAARGMSV